MSSCSVAIRLAGYALITCFAFACSSPEGTTVAEELSQSHPLDPLSVDEYIQAVELLQTADYVNEESRFVSVTLQEPPKEEVLQWREGDHFSRTAFAVVKQGAQIFEATINLSEARVDSWEEIPGAQPLIILEEIFAIVEILFENQEFRSALSERGITDPNEILCAPHSVGYYGIPEHEGRRLVKTPCYFTAGESNNLFSRPIEGLYAIVDLNAREVFEVIDTGLIPLSDDPGGFDQASVAELREAMKPTYMHQPNGNNFSINGHVVEWDKWSFHQRMDKQLGLIISLVNYEDSGNKRPILYQGMLSEIFVPYMDPSEGWFSRTFMDSGEYGFGWSATPLQPGFDCPETGVLLDATFPDDQGNPYPAEDVVCVFERNLGDPAWRHYDAIAGNDYEGRPAVELVVRMIATVGNYDYLIDWVFKQNGRIQVRAGATGIDGLKGVSAASMQDPQASEDTAYGTLVAPHLVAINHDHFFSFRLDIDIDGTNNSFSKDQLKTVSLEEGSRRSIWTVQSKIAKTEREALMDYDPSSPAMWRVLNPEAPGPVGHQPGYILKPGTSAAYNLLSEDDFPRLRAGFVDHHIWVTPYNPDEYFAAGPYPNQSKGGDGLPSWIQDNRPIENTDIVLWYTAGFHHAPRTEDFPIMPTAWHQFELQPFNFFDGNPVLDLPKAWNE